MAGNDGTVVIENADLLPGSFRNFTGKEGMYNREGDRNFAVRLEPDLAQALAQDGWNVKQLKPRGDAEEGDYYLTVSVGFKNRPPRLVLISSKGRVDLGQHECDLLDWVDIKQADIIIRPYFWDVNGKTGIKAYLKSLFITLEEDYLDLKYAEIPYAETGPTNSIEATSQLLSIEAGQNPDVIDVESWEEDEPKALESRKK
jgi:hypothetical protein